MQPGILLLLLPALISLGVTIELPKKSTHTIYKKQASAKTLQQDIIAMDSIFFEAYNTCKMAVMDSVLSENIEFYHDQGGLETSKQEILKALKQNICGKVTRELKKGSIEVYPIANYGAVEMGMHGFHNNQEPHSGPTRFSKFVHIWKKEGGKWRITRVVSLH